MTLTSLKRLSVTLCIYRSSPDLDFRFFSAYMKKGTPRKVTIFAISNP